jgi:hypothetical protein
MNRAIETKNYVAIHSWLKRHFPKQGKCDVCKTNKAQRYEYALKNGYEYSKNRANYDELCVSCHRKRDSVEPWNKGLFKREKSNCLYCYAVFQPLNNGSSYCSFSCASRRRRNKPVVAYMGEDMHIFQSTMDAQRSLNIGNSSIVSVCKGKKKTAGGYHWRYV